jgi:hypothetical protein
MAPTTHPAAGIALVHTALGDFFVPEESALHQEVRETGGQARAGLAMLSSRLGPGATVLDLGAGVGMLAVPLQRVVGTTGRVWCFEPEAEAAGLLRWNLAANGVDLLVQVVAGEGWPRLDDWCDAAGLDRVDAIRAHGPEATGALAEGGCATLARHLPLVLFTWAHEAGAGEGEVGPAAAELTRLGYSFHSGTDAPEAAEDEPAGSFAGGGAAARGGSMLALPPGRAAEGADG